MRDNPNRQLIVECTHLAPPATKPLNSKNLQKLAAENKSTKTIKDSWADFNKRKNRIAEIHSAVLRTKPKIN